MITNVGNLIVKEKNYLHGDGSSSDMLAIG